MNLKRIVTALLSISFTLSMAQTTTAFDISDDLENTAFIEEDYGTDEVTPYTYSIEVPENVEENDQSGIMPMSTTVKKYSINWVIPAGGQRTSGIKVYMTSGDTYKFNLTYSPASANMEIGVIQPDKTFLHYTRSNGTLTSTLTVSQDGIYCVKIKNNSSSSVTFSGTYSFTANCPFEYMFQSDYMATYISSEYGEERSDGTHYAIDITTGVAGEIKDYPVYNTLTGKVIKNGYFTDKVTTCVAITHTNGYTSRFLHMDLSNNGLSLNGNAATGKQIGKVSNKGCSAYHLHLDVNTAGTYDGPSLTASNTIDPRLLFPDISFT